MFGQKLIYLKNKIRTLVFRDKKNDDTNYLENLKKERRKNILKRSFENSIYYTIFGVIFIIISLIIHYYNLSINDLSIYIFLSTLTIEFIGIALLLPFISELKFINIYYSTRYSIMHILYSKQKKKQDSYLEKFQINYNNLRKQMKKQIISSRGNFLTYDYEIKRIVHEIDTFFDATTRILFQRKIMSIPYLPREEVEQYLIEEMARHRLSYNQKSDDWGPYNEYDPDNYDINEINFDSIKEFMRIYGKLIIKNPRKKTINTVAIAELFRKWNLIVNQLEPEIYEQSKKDVDKYYSKKQERQNYLFTKAYEIFVIFLITITSGTLLNILL